MDIFIFILIVQTSSENRRSTRSRSVIGRVSRLAIWLRKFHQALCARNCPKDIPDLARLFGVDEAELRSLNAKMSNPQPPVEEVHRAILYHH